MPSVFDSTVKFNGEVFARAVENLKSTTKVEVVPYLKRNYDRELARMFPAQGGGNVATILISGNLGGTAQNYDGSTDIVPNNVINYSQTVIAIGRVNAWKEKDFILSIAGKSELDNQAFEVAVARDVNVKASALSILTALFDGTNGVLKDITIEKTTSVAVSDLNDAVIKACGDLAKEFDVVVMDSYYAGQLANAKLLEYAKYNDEQGIERVSHDIAYWGGKLVVIDDSVGTNASVGTHNVYAFGRRSWKYCDLLVKYPYELARDSFTKGGVDSLISRQRYILAPYGVSWKGSASIVSPTEEQLATATNYELVEGADGNAISTKIIPFAHLKLTISE